ncbi:Uncharacterised protein [Actinomyces bovis]|uniref:Uncharacterized protein n=1 Tax=Actinomyces bovis TaxID=1658 RepID=A0ABY1VR25_9ACTO|nr:DUF6049 family protein [Actinomyces bovis]SPT54414.1 Uncharacterised protein [Actinomyces bovis]VEG56006.1 Uncharacterised protein [Actinomyces israelii]
MVAGTTRGGACARLEGTALSAWRRRRRPLAVTLWSLLVAVLLVLSPLATPPLALATPATPLPPQTNLEVTEGQVTTSLDALAPEIMTGGEDLVITGTIANGTSNPLTDLVLVVQVQDATPVSVEQLSNWLSGNRDTYLRTVLTETLPATIEPGATAGFSLTVPAANLPLGDSSQWGPRGVQVAVTRDRVTVASDRSYLLLQQAYEIQPTGVLVAVPLTATPAELTALSTMAQLRWTAPAPEATAAPHPTDSASAEPTAHPPESASASATPTAADQTAQAPPDPLLGLVARWSAQLDLARPGVVLGVDPAVLAALGVDQAQAEAEAKATASPTANASHAASEGGVGVTAAPPQGSQVAQPEASAGATAEAVASPAPSSSPSASPTASPAPPPTVVEQLRDKLVAALKAGDVVALPWADADVSGLAHAGESKLIAEARTRADASPLAQLGARKDTAWPASATLDQQTFSALPASEQIVLAPPGTLPVSEDLTYTPSGLTTAEGRVMILPDASASATLRGTMPLGPVMPERSAGALSELDTRQLLRAQTAIVARQLPSVSRDLIVSLDRSTAASTDAQVLSRRVEALVSAPWATPLRLDDMTQHAAAIAQGQGGTYLREVQRSALSPAAVEAGELSAADLDSARNSAAALAAVGATVADAGALLGQNGEVLTWASASAWRSAPTQRQEMLAQVGAWSQNLLGALSMQPSSTVTLISEQANLPVRIASSLPQDATVQVQLSSSSTRLQAEEPVSATIPAHGDAVVMVPVKAVGNGEVLVTIKVKAPDGSEVGEPATVHMLVHAEWESRGIRVVTVGLVLLLVVGIFRTVRRGRRGGNLALAAQVAKPARPKLRED